MVCLVTTSALPVSIYHICAYVTDFILPTIWYNLKNWILYIYYLNLGLAHIKFPINVKYCLSSYSFPLSSHLMRRANSLKKTLMLGKIEGMRRREWQDMMTGWHHWLSGHESEQTPGNSAGHAVVHEVAKSWTRLSAWTINLPMLLLLNQILRDYFPLNV